MDAPCKPGCRSSSWMVGISIGLLTVSVALGALMASRGISSTVSEVSQMQQQAAYAFRVIGQQLRQAGSVELNLAYNKTDEQKKAEPPSSLERVAFEANTNRKDKTIKGNDSPSTNEFRLEVSYQTTRNLISPLLQNLSRSSATAWVKVLTQAQTPLIENNLPKTPKMNLSVKAPATRHKPLSRM